MVCKLGWLAVLCHRIVPLSTKHQVLSFAVASLLLWALIDRSGHEASVSNSANVLRWVNMRGKTDLTVVDRPFARLLLLTYGAYAMSKIGRTGTSALYTWDFEINI